MIADRVTESHRSKWSSAPAPVGIIVEVWYGICALDAVWDGNVWREAKTGARLSDVTHWAAKVQP